MNMTTHLPKLYCLTSDKLSVSHSHQVLKFCEAGVRFIQLRSKSLSKIELLAEVRESVRICRRFQTKLIVNDSIEVAMESDADGVHLGQEDRDISDARKFLGETKVIGFTIHSKNEITEDVLCNANYIGMGPFRKSKTKTDLSPTLSIDDYSTMIQGLNSIPVFLIGGMEIEDFSLSLANHGIAVCSALSEQENLNISKIKAFVDESAKHDFIEACL